MPSINNLIQILSITVLLFLIYCGKQFWFKRYNINVSNKYSNTACFSRNCGNNFNSGQDLAKTTGPNSQGPRMASSKARSLPALKGNWKGPDRPGGGLQGLGGNLSVPGCSCRGRARLPAPEGPPREERCGGKRRRLGRDSEDGAAGCFDPRTGVGGGRRPSHLCDGQESRLPRGKLPSLPGSVCGCGKLLLAFSLSRVQLPLRSLSSAGRI